VPGSSSSGTCSPTPNTTYHDLGADYYQSRIDKEQRKRHLIGHV